jgi:RimJ/RimL family protein N-acetyltransferase
MSGPRSSSDVGEMTLDLARSPEHDNLEAPITPSLMGARVLLKPIEPRDYDFLYRLAVDPETGFRWRWRGGTPGGEDFNRFLWNQVTAQFIVLERRSGTQIGVVTAYGTNLRDRWTYIAVCGDPRAHHRGLGVEAVALFVDYLFTVWDFYKIYFEIPEYNLRDIAQGIEDYFELEGRLSDHLYHGGRRWAMHIYSVARDHWNELAGQNATVQFCVKEEPQVDNEKSFTLSLDEFLSLVASSLDAVVDVTPESVWDSLGRADGRQRDLRDSVFVD